VRTGAIVVAALVAVLPAVTVAQAPPGMPPGMPSMEEMMRNAPGGPPGARGRRPEAPAPPGVPVPLDSPLMAAFQRLDDARTYRVRMDMVVSDPRMQQMAAQAGMGRIDKAVVRPDTQLITFSMRMPATDLGPGKFDDWDVRAVVNGARAARKLDSAAVPRLLALQEAKMAQQLAMLDMMSLSTLAQAAAGPPSGRSARR
jgi:hypothetical protein